MRDGREQGPSAADEDGVTTLLEVVRDLVAEVRPAAVGAVRLGARLEADLGLDSLAIAELLVRVEERFACTLPEEILVRMETPSDLVGALSEAVGGPTRVASSSTAPDDVVLAGDDVVLAGGGAVPKTPSSVLGTLYGIYALAVFAVLTGIVFPMMVLTPGVGRRWRLIGRAGRLLFRLTGVPVTVRGTDHLPASGPYVLAANHASFLDPLVLAPLLAEPPVWVAVSGLAENPLVRLFLHRMDAHLVGRGDRVRAAEDRRALTDLVRAGRSVAFFPEGRRSPAPGLEPFRLGAFLVAADAGVPVVPVALRGTRQLLPVGQRLPRWSRITVTVEPAVRTVQPGWTGAMELHHATRAAILRRCGEPDLA